MSLHERLYQMPIQDHPVPNNKAGNNKCAELEIGKNSVNPCIKPKRKLRRTSFIYFFVLRY
jgi:hypothetical protein